jgi:hypothetical protein
MTEKAPFDKRFSPTPAGIVVVSFISYLKQHPPVRWSVIVAGVVIVIAPAIWLVGHIVSPETFSTLFPAMYLLYGSMAGFLLLYFCALAGPGYNVFVAPAPETTERERAENVVRESPTPKSVLELDSARLTEYYAINQSQAKASFRWAVVAFLLGFGTILLGIWLFYLRQESKSESMAWLTTIAGVVTNAVSAMFLYLYNTTREMSLYYYNQLIRVQMIDLAIRLAESHADDGEKTKARNKIMADLLAISHAVGSALPSSLRKRGKTPSSTSTA